ncbi:hypothetical protein N4G41_24895 [Kosakonia sacchari]|uniref:hypothetical protein n=1 Tax=Kosakonia sacchari TaxID=1158459 RepID=UPI002ACD6F62|nr:hypothetical protein [Kosakonia sacchari]MDZ7324873.1 hypothetical protein [Kosakonia sacchari]
MITNHKLLNYRIVSILVAAVFALDVYIDVNEYFMFPLFLLQLVTFALAFALKKKRKEKSIVNISRGGSVALLLIYTCAVGIGITVSMTTSRPLDTIFLLLVYVVILDALMSIPFVLSFTDKATWQSSYSGSGFGNDSPINSANGQAMTGYTDSSGCLPGCGTPSWPVETYTSSTSHNHDW